MSKIDTDMKRASELVLKMMNKMSKEDELDPTSILYGLEFGATIIELSLKEIYQDPTKESHKHLMASLQGHTLEELIDMLRKGGKTHGAEASLFASDVIRQMRNVERDVKGDQETETSSSNA